MKKVKIKVIGIQSGYNRKEEKIELLTEASFYIKNDSYYIVYDESNLDGMEGCKTKLKIKDNKLSMIKFGTCSSNIEFEKGKRYSTSYLTQFGKLDMEVLTMEYIANINDDGIGTIDVKYKVNLAGVDESINKLHIETF